MLLLCSLVDISKPMEQSLYRCKFNLGVLGRLKNVLDTHKPKRIANNGEYKESAVLVPFRVDRCDLNVVFTQRTNELPHHRGQISFPGGKVDPEDRDAEETVLREVEEEIGIQREKIHLLGRLDDELTLVSGFLIHPFVGILEEGFYQLNPEEVERIIEVPLTFLLNQRPYERDIDYEGGTIRSMCYVYEGNIIWGATFRILNKLLMLLK